MGGSWSAAASVNLAKSGNISRNAPCPCGSKKKYKRYVLFIDSRSRNSFVVKFMQFVCHVVLSRAIILKQVTLITI
jgi:hypothetical protein